MPATYVGIPWILLNKWAGQWVGEWSHSPIFGSLALYLNPGILSARRSIISSNFFILLCLGLCACHQLKCNLQLLANPWLSFLVLIGTDWFLSFLHLTPYLLLRLATENPRTTALILLFMETHSFSLSDYTLLSVAFLQTRLYLLGWVFQNFSNSKIEKYIT